MADSIVEYNNPAGRLLKIIQAFPATNSYVKIGQVADILGSASDWENVLNAVIDVRKEYQALEAQIEENKENEHKYKLYRENLGDIQKCVEGFMLNMVNSTGATMSNASAVIALKYMAVDLPQESFVPKDDIEELRRLCDELRDEIHCSQDLSKILKEWLLDLVRLMRDGIDRYKVRGSRGFRRQLYEMLGSMMANYEEVKAVKSSAPTIWEKMCKGFDLVVRFSENAEKGAKVLKNIHKVLSFVWGEDTSPPMLEGPTNG